MKDKTNVYYDEEGDILEIQIGDPAPAYYEEISEGVFERIDEKTKEIKGFAIFSFKKRLSDKKDFHVSIPVGVQRI